MPRTLITGSASGIGAATAQAPKAAGLHVIGVDRRDADIVGDLSTAAGRAQIIQQALARGEGRSMAWCYAPASARMCSPCR